MLLGLTSLIFALLGHEVNCACYSAHLSARDYKAFEHLFDVFGVKSRITYSTIDDLAKSFVNKAGNLTDALLNFLQNGTGATAVQGGDAASKKVLLIDEVWTMGSRVLHFLPLALRTDCNQKGC